MKHGDIKWDDFDKESIAELEKKVEVQNYTPVLFFHFQYLTSKFETSQKGKKDAKNAKKKFFQIRKMAKCKTIIKKT